MSLLNWLSSKRIQNETPEEFYKRIKYEKYKARKYVEKQNPNLKSFNISTLSRTECGMAFIKNKPHELYVLLRWSSGYIPIIMMVFLTKYHIFELHEIDYDSVYYEIYTNYKIFKKIISHKYLIESSLKLITEFIYTDVKNTTMESFLNCPLKMSKKYGTLIEKEDFLNFVFIYCNSSQLEKFIKIWTNQYNLFSLFIISAFLKDINKLKLLLKIAKEKYWSPKTHHDSIIIYFGFADFIEGAKMFNNNFTNELQLQNRDSAKKLESEYHIGKLLKYQFENKGHYNEEEYKYIDNLKSYIVNDNNFGILTTYALKSKSIDIRNKIFEQILPKYNENHIEGIYHYSLDEGSIEGMKYVLESKSKINWLGKLKKEKLVYKQKNHKLLRYLVLKFGIHPKKIVCNYLSSDSSIFSFPNMLEEKFQDLMNYRLSLFSVIMAKKNNICDDVFKKIEEYLF